MPMVHRLETVYWDRIDFIYLDQYDDDNRPFLRERGLNGRPIFLLLEPDGTEVTRWYGSRPEEEIRQVLDDYLAQTAGETG